MAETIIVIPARYASTRLPGKPLAPIAGRAMIERVWRIARAAGCRTLVATDHEAIAAAVRAFGGEAVMTPPECRNGTERALAAIDALGLAPDVVVNLQGDAPITPPWVIGAMIEAMQAPGAEIGTPAVRLTGEAARQFIARKKDTPASGTTVVMNRAGEALYFSKAVLPFSRTGAPAEIFRHIGLYAYRLDALRRLIALPETPLEKSEQLEQLRALEHGMRIRVAVVDYRGRSHASVDSPEDVARVEAIIAREGELLAD